jgi:hypothetical protein
MGVVDVVRKIYYLKININSVVLKTIVQKMP